jgi:acetylornithine/succinyldiaminopimelate/putrescine aminotransferase
MSSFIADQVLKMMPSLLPNVVERGDQLRAEMLSFEASSEGLFAVQGQGLMWGALLDRTHPLLGEGGEGAAGRVMSSLRRACARTGVLPYFVPAGGFMVTPLFDVEPAVVREIGARLTAALLSTMAELRAGDMRCKSEVNDD